MDVAGSKGPNKQHPSSLPRVLNPLRNKAKEKGIQKTKKSLLLLRELILENMAPI